MPTFYIDSGSITGSLQGTASWASNALTASLAPNYVLNSATSSFVVNSQTSSFVQNSQTSSFVTNSQTSSFVTNSQTSSFVTNSQTSSFVQNSQTSSFVTNSQTSSFVQNSQTSSFVTNAQTSSFVTNSQTSSFVQNNQTSSFATTGSNIFKGNQTISGSTTITGSLTLNGGSIPLYVRNSTSTGSYAELQLGYLNTSSFGIGETTNGSDQNRTFYIGTVGIAGSSSYDVIEINNITRRTAILSGLDVTGTLNASNITGSIFGTASYAATASLAPNYVLNSATSSFATTGANSFNGNQIITGSLTASGSSTIVVGAMAIGTSSLGPSENTLTLGARDAAGEGGQLGLLASGGTYTSSSYIDNYQNQFRILSGRDNVSSNAAPFILNLGTGAITTTGNINGATPTEMGYLSGVTSAIQTQINNKGYTVMVGCLASAMTNAQTIYYGHAGRGTSGSGAVARVYIPQSGTIKTIYIVSSSATAGTSESWTMSLRLNNTTNTSIASVAAATTTRVWTGTGLSISVVAGDYIEITSTNPTWATPPGSTSFYGTVYIQ